MAGFMRLNLKPGVSPPAPPAGEAPPSMAKRPAGSTPSADVETYDLDRESLRDFRRPFFFAPAAQRPRSIQRDHKRLSGVFPDYTLEVFDERHPSIHRTE